MSLTSKLKKLLSKTTVKQRVALVLHQQGLTICCLSNKQYMGYQQLALKPNGHGDTLTQFGGEQKMTGSCVLVLPPDSYQVVQVDKPNVPDEEINGALKWQIKDQVIIAPDDMVLDYFSVPALLGSAEKVNVVCTSLSKLLVLVTALSKGKLELDMVTTEEFAFAGLIEQRDDAILLVCQQPGEEVLLLIVKNGQLHFHRRLRGYNQLASMDESQLMSGKIDSLSLEIQRSADYFERQLKQSPVRGIEILLPIAHEAFCARKLAENTNLSVTLFELPEGQNDQREYAIAIGATRLQNQENSTLG